MHFNIGDDVTVEFKGYQTAGEIVAVYRTSGYVMCRVHIDPSWDHGKVGENLDPEPYICVRQDKVTAAETSNK